MNERGMLALLIVGSFLLSLAAAEGVTRLLTRVDADGGLYVRSVRILPFRMPVRAVREKALAYEAEGDATYIRADPDLGWTIRPGGASRDGVYLSDQIGLRSPSRERHPASRPAPGVLRIALFGDSFTHGNDVVYEDSWAAVLADRLAGRGMAAEVLNLGVGGFGVDQAYLRWRKRGRALAPAVVVFGFQSSNCKRNLNLIRVLYSPNTGLVFSKPRLLLEGEGLRAINVPTVPPDRLPELLADFEAWEHSPHELFYRRQDYRDRPLYASRLAALLQTGIQTRYSKRRKDIDFFGEGSDERRLCERIIDTFADEVEDAGMRFQIVHLPTRKPLRGLLRGGDLEYRDMLEALRRRHTVADPTDELVQHARETSLDALFATTGGHYSPDGYRIVGEAVAREIR
jgi:lysophospholipase L1-like esterase